jgi:hypothetical protein
MNLITLSTIYSLYPHATFQSGLNLHLVCDGREADQQPARAKYDQRGWTTVCELSNDPWRTPRQALAMRARWLGDRYTLSIPLGGSSTVPPDGDLGFWAANLWALETIAVGRSMPSQLIITMLRLPSSEVVCVFDVQLANVLERIMPKLLAQLGGSVVIDIPCHANPYLHFPALKIRFSVG